MRNFPDEGGVDYVLEPGTGGDAIPLAAMEGHFRGPALSWPELIIAARQPDPEHTPAQRLLLLLPACADRARPADAAQTVADALIALGATAHLDRTADELLSSTRYWTRDCAWTTVDDTVICLGSHSYRRPGGELTPTDLHQVTNAFSESYLARRDRTS
nr:hypothetical protein GCM10020063_054930 [Dactylosporangium thailandense]